MFDLKGQMNIEFILGVSVLVMTISFIGFTIVNYFPSLHVNSVYETMKSKSFQASHMLVLDSGRWTDAKISNCSRMGLTNGIPNMLNASKVASLESCSQIDYARLKTLMSVDSGADIIINITQINFSGGPDIRIAECRPALISIRSPKFWSKRLAVIDNTTRQIVRVEVAVYGYG